MAWLFVIWGHSMQPAIASQNESGRFLEVIHKIIPIITNDDNGMFIIRKAAHFTEYLILGTLLCIEFSPSLYGIINRFFTPSLVGLLVAFIDETIQIFVEGRSGEIRDIWIDFSGVMLGTLIVLAIVNNKRGRRR